MSAPTFLAAPTEFLGRSDTVISLDICPGSTLDCSAPKTGIPHPQSWCVRRAVATLESALSCKTLVGNLQTCWSQVCIHSPRQYEKYDSSLIYETFESVLPTSYYIAKKRVKTETGSSRFKQEAPATLGLLSGVHPHTSCWTTWAPILAPLFSKGSVHHDNLQQNPLHLVGDEERLDAQTCLRSGRRPGLTNNCCYWNQSQTLPGFHPPCGAQSHGNILPRVTPCFAASAIPQRSLAHSMSVAWWDCEPHQGHLTSALQGFFFPSSIFKECAQTASKLSNICNLQGTCHLQKQP